MPQNSRFTEFQHDILHALWATIAELYPPGNVFDELAELRRLKQKTNQSKDKPIPY